MIIEHGKAYINKIQRTYGVQLLTFKLKNYDDVLIDCGYSNELNNITNKKGISFELVKLIEPIKPLAEKLIENEITNPIILLTHFHPDHIGELNNLPKTQVYCNYKQLQKLLNSSEEEQLSEMFIKEIFENSQHEFIDVFQNRVYESVLNEYFTEVYQIFDNQVLVVKLPGHNEDQIGYFSVANNILYVGDAIMQIEDLDNQKINEILRAVAKDKKIADQTFEKLLKISNETAIKLIPSHYQIENNENEFNKGLKEKDIESLREKYGYNEISRKKPKTKLEILVEIIKDPIIFIMMAAALLSFISGAREGHYSETVVIAILIIVNITIAFIQELKTQKELKALEDLNEAKALVIRDGQEKEILARELLPGDVVKIRYGTICKADMRILESNNLFADEAFLTGESDLIKKQINDPIFSNSMVKDGQGLALVEKIGLETRIGQINKQVDQITTSKSQLELKILDITKKLVFVAVITSIFVFTLGMLNDLGLEQSLKMLISILVATVPEGLATVLVIVLTFMGRNLSENNALIKRVDLLETLGELSYVCSDKTGTITKNNMEVVKVIPFNSNQITNGILKAVIDKETPTSRSVSEFLAKKQTAENVKIIATIPFNSSTKKSINLVSLEGQNYLVVFGAPDYVMPNNPKVAKSIEEIAKEGLRTVLAASCKTTLTNLQDEKLISEELNNLEIIELYGIQDPPKKSSIKAISELKAAGIKVVMITGDHKETATSIARQVGILYKKEHLVLTGDQLKQLSEEEFRKIVKNVRVYARVQPEDKNRIVTALQELGEITAMTGDGTNDSIALKKADVGIAMGIAGTDISKEAADLLLLDDNFATITKAVNGGRLIFANLRKFMRQMLTSNAAHVGSLLFALIAGVVLNNGNSGSLLLPMTPILILWVNVVSDSIPSLAIGFDEAENDLMNEKPIGIDEKILTNKAIFQILSRGLGLGLMVFIAFNYIYNNFGQNEELSRSVSFIILSFGQLIHIFDARANKTIFKRNLFSSKAILGAVSISALLNLMLVYSPLNTVFGLTPIPLTWLIVAIVYSSILTLLLAALELLFRKEK